MSEHHFTDNNRFKILIVDDVPSNLFTLHTLLEEHFSDVEIVEANSGFEALEILMRENIDLIILDIQMPEMDGFQTAKLVRSRKKTKNIPIVFLTAAYKSEEFREKGFSLGATDYLTKPIDDYQLTNRINAYLSIIKLEKTHKQELEKKVEERTATLRETLTQLKDSNEKLETALSKLKNAQRQVIAQEKLASLGELTAGIAHEIKNPLNFIINFSEISGDLIIELAKNLNAIRAKNFTDKDIDDTLDILNNLTENSHKIHEHGKRADSIINNMLMHSHDKKGVYQDVNLNTMLQEYASLAYHSMLNNYKGFACKVIKDLDNSVEPVKVIPQDLSRVFLNMLNNAFYALYRRKQSDPLFEPILNIRTVNHKEKVEIVFRDNGMGINPEIMDKIFNPFFTTKPAGEGTGLGLSICYDIIKNIHKGEILVDSKIGEYTEFSVFIPKKPN